MSALQNLPAKLAADDKAAAAEWEAMAPVNPDTPSGLESSLALSRGAPVTTGTSSSCPTVPEVQAVGLNVSRQRGE
jgi:hypothetical protein